MSSLNLKVDMSHLTEEFVDHISELALTTARKDFSLDKLANDVDKAFLNRAPYLLNCVTTCQFLQDVAGNTCQCGRQAIKRILVALCQKEGFEKTGPLIGNFYLGLPHEP